MLTSHVNKTKQNSLKDVIFKTDKRNIRKGVYMKINEFTLLNGRSNSMMMSIKTQCVSHENTIIQ